MTSLDCLTSTGLLMAEIITF